MSVCVRVHVCVCTYVFYICARLSFVAYSYFYMYVLLRGCVFCARAYICLWRVFKLQSRCYRSGVVMLLHVHLHRICKSFFFKLSKRSCLPLSENIVSGIPNLENSSCKDFKIIVERSLLHLNTSSYIENLLKTIK